MKALREEVFVKQSTSDLFTRNTAQHTSKINEVFIVVSTPWNQWKLWIRLLSLQMDNGCILMFFFSFFFIFHFIFCLFLMDDFVIETSLYYCS
jgi:hypothetical protein